MFISQTEAQTIFDALPNDRQYPTLDPEYLDIDLLDNPEREPIFWSKSYQSEIVLIGSSVGPALDHLVDFESQRGYGGATSTLPCASPAWRDVWEDFNSDLRDRNGLASFFRFTPLLKNHTCFTGDVVLDRHTIAINLTDDQEPLKIFATRARTAVRKAIKNGVTGRWAETSDDWVSFVELYRQRMAELDASEQYLFSDEYFKRMESWKQTELFLCYLEDELLAGSIFIKSPCYWEYHLSASNRKGMKKNATQWIIWNASEMAKSKNVDFLHLGGGTDNKPDNPLFFFKRGFSKENYPFYFGKSILNDDAYQATKRDFEALDKPTGRVLFYR